MYKSYIPTHLVRWVHGDHTFDVTDTCFEHAVIGNHVRVCRYLITETSLLTQPSRLIQKLPSGQHRRYPVKSIIEGAYNLFGEKGNLEDFSEAGSFDNAPYGELIQDRYVERYFKYNTIVVKQLILQIIARYGTRKLVNLLPESDDKCDTISAIAMAVFRDNMEALCAIVRRYGWVYNHALVGYARSLGMMCWLRKRIPVPRHPDRYTTFCIIEKFCQHDADDILHGYVERYLREPAYFIDFLRLVLRISYRNNAKKIMMRYIIGASNDIVRADIMYSLASPGICVEWLWEHRREGFTPMTELMRDLLSMFYLEGVIWLMEHGATLTANQMNHIIYMSAECEDSSDVLMERIEKIKELYAAQPK